MGYEIFFDESHKLDRHTSQYSYYGAIGCKETIRKNLDKIMEDSRIIQELHFNKFNLDKINSYLKALHYAINNFQCNFYIVDSEKAFNICDKIEINASKLRELFYIKIPERLIYGLIRNLDDFNSINIFIDNSDEYKKYDLENKLKSQLNAQSIYRNLHCLVKDVTQVDSKSSKAVQVTDIILGIIVFLFEERYYSVQDEMPIGEMAKLVSNSLLTEKEQAFIKNAYIKENNKFVITIKSEKKKIAKLKTILNRIKYYTQNSIAKSEFIYRLLRENGNLNKIYDFSIFLWNGNKVKVEKENISKYVAQFFQFKMEFDNFNKIKILELYMDKCKNGELLHEKEYTNYLGFGSKLKEMVRRYLEELKIKTGA